MSKDESISREAKELFAKNLWGLIFDCRISEIEKAINIILEQGEWGVGWMSLREVIERHEEKIPEEVLNELKKLKTLLQPKTLVEEVRAYILSPNAARYQFLRNEGNNSKIRELGQMTAGDDKVFKEILPEALCSNSMSIFAFALGLADTCVNPYDFWTIIKSQVMHIKGNKTSAYNLLSGFLCGLNERDSELTGKILDESVKDELSEIFPLLQTKALIGKNGADRFIRSIELGKAPVWLYRNIACGRTHEAISDEDLIKIITLLIEVPDGLNVALEIYAMRIFEKKIEEVSKDILSLGRKMVLQYDYSKSDRMDTLDYNIAQIIEFCFSMDETETKEQALMLCKKLKQNIVDDKYSLFKFEDVLFNLAKTQPEIFLDSFLHYSENVSWKIQDALYRSPYKPTLDAIEQNTILKWCNKLPESRYKILASSLRPYSFINKEKRSWNPIALAIINNAPNPSNVLDILDKNINPDSWSGEYSWVLKESLVLIEQLLDHSDSRVSNWAKSKIEEYKVQIQKEELNKKKEDSDWGV